MQATGKVGLFGAAGAAGQSIAAALERGGPRLSGGRPLAPSRSRPPSATIRTRKSSRGIRTIPASIRAAAAGLQTVIYLVGVPYDQFAAHPPLMEKTLAGVDGSGRRTLHSDRHGVSVRPRARQSDQRKSSA